MGVKRYFVMNDESPLLKVAEVAPILRCKSCTVRAMIERGQLPYVRVGRLLFVRKQAVLDWIEGAEKRKRLATFRPHTAVNR